MKYLFSILICCFLSFTLFSQDAVFGQYYLSPLNLNPALTGSECGDQVIINYRDQWRNNIGSTGYKSLSISYDRPVKLKNGDQIGIGAKYFFDQASSFNLTIQNFSADFSYQKTISKTENAMHTISGGVELGTRKRSIDVFNLNWISSESEPFTVVDTEYFFDMGVGLNYSGSFRKIKKLTAGIAIYHPNRPNIDFFESTKVSLDVRYTFYTQTEINISKKTAVIPRAMYTSQGSSDMLLGGIGLKQSFGSNQKHSVELGGALRFANNLGKGLDMSAILISGTYFYKNIGFSALIEFNQSELNGEGIDTYEGAVIYRFCK